MNQSEPFDQARLVSFDVFNTVVTRAVAEPRGVFLLLARRLEGNPELRKLAGGFLQARMLAEEETRRRADGEETTLAAIYQALTSALGLSEKQRELLYAWELEAERSVSRPVSQTLELIAQMRRDGKRILFVSDMYLPEWFIRELLVVAGAFQEGDGLYVSSRYGVTKHSGNLFRAVLAAEGISPEDLLHIGDDRHSDFRVPRRLAIPALPFSDADLIPSELLLLGGGNSRNLAGQALAGASRCARVAASCPRDHHERALYQAGVTFAGPVFSSFVTWLLRQAREARLERLYFVARDGQVLRLVAQRMEHEAQGVELCYLYGSRQAWHLPGTLACDASTADWLLLADPHVSLSVVARRGNLDPAELARVLASCSLSSSDMDRLLTESEIAKLRELICQPSPLQKLLDTAACKAREQAVAYFQAEGLFDDVPWGIVDLGWHGNLQDSLERILRSAGYDRPVLGYYFGLLRGDRSPCRKKAYFFTAEPRDDYFAWGSACMTILEVLASGDHGVTRGYCRRSEDSAVIPQVDPYNTPALQWGLEHLRAGVLAYVREAGVNGALPDPAQARALLLPVIRWFCTDPPTEFAAALGKFPFSSDQAEMRHHPFAPPITLFQALFYLANYAHPRRFLATYWIHGGKVQSSVITRGLLNLASRIFWAINRLERKSVPGE